MSSSGTVDFASENANKKVSSSAAKNQADSDSDASQSTIPPLSEKGKEGVNKQDGINLMTDPQFCFYTIWDSPFIRKLGEFGTVSEEWQCLHCNKTYQKHNATKALFHGAQRGGFNISPCKSVIPTGVKNRYILLLEAKLRQKKRRKSQKRGLDDSIVDRRDSAGEYALSKRSKSSASMTLPTSKDSPIILTTPESRISEVTISSSSTSDASSSRKAIELVRNTSTSHSSSGKGPFAICARTNRGGNTKLTMAIADLIHACGLPFTLSSDPRFKHMLQLARFVGSDYKPPNRNAVSGPLLEANHAEYKKRNIALAKLESGTYGLSMFGDGATVRKMPLINILLAGVHNPACVVRIADCTEALQAGATKDASFIARLFLTVMKEIDPTKELIDVLYFDGASNVQKAGKILALHYPRVTCLHGAEHVIALFFSDLGKIPFMNLLMKVYKLVYRLFGSGAHHSPYAMFKKHTRLLNKGRDIGLSNAIEGRFATYMKAFLRFVRLYPALVAVVNSVEFKELKLKKKWHQQVIKIIADRKYIQCVVLVIDPLRPALKTLRLADASEAGMDCLRYLVLQTTERLKSVEDELNSTDLFGEFLTSINLQSISRGEIVIPESDDFSDHEDLQDDDILEYEDEFPTPDSVLRADFGTQCVYYWNKRVQNLDSPYAKSAWILNVDPVVMLHVKEHLTG